MERSVLYRRIDARVDRMMAEGLLDEVESLLNGGIPIESQAMQGIGYKELVSVLTENRPLAGAVSNVKLNSRHYAKRQLTWFKRDEQIHWLDAAQETAQSEALRIARAFLEGNEP